MSALGTVLGQENAISLLRRQLATDRLANTYLFLGPGGSGKKTAAMAFATAVLCPEEMEGCGVCSACRRIDAGAHPDIHLIERTEDSAVIKIDQMRELQDELALTPFEAKRKVAVIIDAERLNPHAANAFLKTAEEPAGSAILILTASNEASLLETLVSRCRIVRFRPLPAAILRDILVACGIDAHLAEAVSAVSAGSVKQAMSLANSELASHRIWLIEKIASLEKVNPVDLADDVISKCTGKNLTQTRDSITLCLGFLSLLLRDARVLQSGAPRNRCHNADSAEAVTRLSDSLTEREVDAMFHTVERCGDEVRANVKPNLSLTRMFANFTEICA